MRLIASWMFFILSFLYSSISTNATGENIQKYNRPTLVTVSWYGKDFHGETMSNGKPFNMHKVSAAHCDLPLGTKVLFTNHLTGQWIVAEITDRGPWDLTSLPSEPWKRKMRKYLTPHKKRRFDLSEMAAIKLGIKEQGVTKIYAVVIG